MYKIIKSDGNLTIPKNLLVGFATMQAMKNIEYINIFDEEDAKDYLKTLDILVEETV